LHHHVAGRKKPANELVPHWQLLVAAVGVQYVTQHQERPWNSLGVSPHGAPFWILVGAAYKDYGHVIIVGLEWYGNQGHFE
jgi:hypothetical protein